MNTVSFFGCADAAEYSLPAASVGGGAFAKGRGGRLSRRPFCRIYPVGKGWGLELERNSAWLAGLSLPSEFRFFKSLTAAIAFAEANGFDYRVIRASALFTSRRHASATAGRWQRRRNSKRPSSS